MKLPNGYGSVTKMKGRRRNPYMVRKTTGWHYDPEKDRQVQDYIIIGYAKTKAEGLKMLAEYNENPYDAKAAKITFAELYNDWSKQKYPTISKSNMSGYVAAYKACTVLYDRKFAELRLDDLQHAIDVCGKNYPIICKIDTLFNQLYDHAIKHDICSKNYASYVDILQYKDRNPKKRERTRISNEHVSRMWELSDDPRWQTILMLIYTGCRVSELLDLKKADVSLGDQYFDVTKSKTDNGIRRVPIADKVLPFFKKWYNECPECPYLLHTENGLHFKYNNYYGQCFMPLMQSEGMDYTPHYTRHTTASMMADAGIDPTIQKKILGHSGAMSLTERIYTHLDVRVLIDAINKI